MMAKMFYTLDETKSALGKSEEEIKQFSREGRLREFRDGPRLMFKADQVDSLKNDLGGSGHDIGVSDTGVPIGLADSGGIGSGVGSGIGSGIGSGVGSGMGTGVGLSLAEDTGQSSGAGMNLKDDTALAADLGLSGSMGGMPSPAAPRNAGSMMSGSGLSGSVTGSRLGVNVLGDDADHHDPMAQTNIAPAIGRDQINLEGVGSGSGLLDLTRESDDTSLGAALLDEITPGSGKRSSEPAGGNFGELDSPRGAPRGAGFVVQVEAPDDLAPAFGGLALGGFVMLLVALLVLSSGVVGAQSDLAIKMKDYGLWAIFGIGLVVAIIFFGGGLVIGKVMKR